MEAQILHFRQGRHTQKNNHMLILINNITSRKDAEKLVNKNVIWTSIAGKKITGKIASPHGNKGVLRVIFERGLPGQSIGSKVKVE